MDLPAAKGDAAEGNAAAGGVAAAGTVAAAMASAPPAPDAAGGDPDDATVNIPPAASAAAGPDLAPVDSEGIGIAPPDSGEAALLDGPALREIVLGDILSRPQSRAALDRWYAWRAEAADRRVSSHALARELAETLASPAVAALMLWHEAAGPALQLRAWFDPATLRRLLSIGPDPDLDIGRPRQRQAMARLEEAVDRDIAAIDTRLSRQTEAVFHEERFRRLEGSWRGIWWLAARIPPSSTARIRVRMLVLRWPELCRDLERAVEFDQSQLFKKVYEEEFGTAGGEPYGLLCADYQVRPFPGPGSPTDDVSALDGLAAIAAAAFSPTVVAAHPSLIGLDDFAELGASVDPVDPMRGPERRRWRSLQDRDDTRFLSVLLPRALARGAWPDDGNRADRFRFLPDPGDPGARTWMSPIYPFAAVVMRAFASWNWPADIRGASIGEQAFGGVIDRLPVERLPSDPPGPPPRPPVEVALTDEQERQLVETGLLPMIGLDAGLPEAVFAAAPSLHRPPRMGGPADAAAGAAANQRLSAQFNAMLCVSRFAHCIKIMGREMVGSFQTAQAIEGRLQEWLLQFASASSNASGDSGARQPLRNARVEVSELPGKPGVYGCTIHLQPHYQLDEVGAAFRLVTELDAPGKAAA